MRVTIETVIDERTTEEFLAATEALAPDPASGESRS